MSSGVAQRFIGQRSPFDNDNVVTFRGQVYGVAWADTLGYFCAVGEAPAGTQTLSAISPDGITWVTDNNAPVGDGYIGGIAWSESLGLFVLAGKDESTGFLVATSPDGLIWEAQTTPVGVGEPAQCVCWSDALGLFVVGIQGANSSYPLIITSPDGVTWTNRATPWDGTSFPVVYFVCWSPDLGLFCAVGKQSATPWASVMTSPDGITWTSRTTPMDGSGDSQGTGACWSTALSLFVVAGTDSSLASAVVTSPDGTTWTLQPTPVSGEVTNIYDALIEADGVLFLGNQRGQVISTLDAMNWVYDVVPGWSAGNGAEVYAFAYSPTLNLLVAGAYGGFGPEGEDVNLPCIATCTPVPEPGVQYSCIPDWTTRATPSDGTSMYIVNAVCWSPDLGLFCAVGGSDTTGNNAIMTSPDGITWTNRGNPWDTGNGGEGNCVCWAPSVGLFCAAGFGDNSTGPSSNIVATSPDGVTWTLQSTPWDTHYPAQGQGIAWSESQTLFVLVGDGRGAGTSAMTSPDGVTWTAIHTPFDSGGAYCVAFSEPLGLWAVGTSHGSTHGLICTSPDAAAWTNRATPLDAPFSESDAIVWDDDHAKFYFLGFSSTVEQVLLSSSDGITWGVLHTPFDDDSDYTQALTTGNGWIVIGSNADEPMALAQSYDGGETWFQTSSVFDSPTNEAFALAYSPTLDLFVAGGNAGGSYPIGDHLIATNTFPSLTPIPASARFYEAAPWRWVVADLTGATVTFLDPLAMNRAITYTLGDAAVATCDLPSDNPEIDLNMDDEPLVTFNDKILYCLRREDVSVCSPWVIRFAGIIMQLNDEITPDTDAPVTHLTAYDPWKYLDSRPLIDPVTVGLPGQNGVTYAADGVTTPAIIALDVLALSIAYSQAEDPHTTPVSAQNCFIDSTSGHVPPFADDTTPIDEAYNFSNASTVGDAWRQLMTDGMCEITLSPVYPMDPVLGAICRLDIWQQAGNANNNDAIFSFDLPGRSLVGMNRLQDGTTMANHISLRAGSAGTLTPTQLAIDSTEKFGPYWYQTAITGKLAYPTLVSYLAQAQLKLMLQGVRTITIDPAPEQSPIPLIDYKLGDYVPLYSTNAFRQAIGPGPAVDGEWTNTWRITVIPITIPDDAPETVSQLMLTQPSGNI